jgi:hypothetical protein
MKLKQMFDVKINRIVHISSLTGLAILALTSQPMAAANDGKSFPGAMCHEQLAGQATSVVRGVDGFFNFSDTITVTASCPIVRDGIINGGINAAFVRVVDRASNRDVVCTLYSLQSNGLRQQSETRATADVNTAGETLTFNAMQAADDGYYHLSCDIPPDGPGGTSRIISYRVDEEN